MKGFEQRKERKKESILLAAQELFQVYGFKKVSINDIAGKAGVSQVTIYNHFGSKDDLVREIARTQFENMLEKYREIIKSDMPFPEKMETIVFDKTQIAAQYHGEFTQTLLRSDPQMRQFVESLWQKDVNQMTLDLLEDGRRQGFVSPDISRKAIMLYLEIFRRGVFASTDLIAGLKPNVKLFRELNFIFIYGLVGKRK
jgi:AcrR family transcriptional regulator